MEKLKKKLRILKEVSIDGNFFYIPKIVTLLNNGKAIVVSKERVDSHLKDFPELYPLNLLKIETWSTYNDCVNLKFSLNKTKLNCQVTIYNGDSFDGRRLSKNFIATLLLPIEFIYEIKNHIDSSFEDYLEVEYEVFLMKEKKKWINNKEKSLLNNL